MGCMVKQDCWRAGHSLPPAAAALSLQLFMLQMDEVVISTGPGRGPALCVSSNLQFMKRRSKCFLHTEFLSLEFPRTAWLLMCESKIVLPLCELGKAVLGTLAKCVSVTDVVV